MNWDEIQGKWTQMKGTLREKWGKLTDDDLERIAGNKDKLVGVLQERYGWEKERAQREYDTWLSKSERLDRDMGRRGAA